MARTARPVEALRRLVAKQLVVGLMISQMSRSTSRLARAGELVGRDAADAGAESAALERSAAVTLTIGEVSEPDAEGWRDVVLSRGKSRYGGSDTVFTLRQRGASGTTFVKGAASGQAVRQARATRREDAKQQQMRSAVMEAVRGAAEPLFKGEIRAALNKNRGGCNSAIAALVESGELVGVPSGEAARTRNPRFWDRERAASLRVSNPHGSPPNAPPTATWERRHARALPAGRMELDARRAAQPPPTAARAEAGRLLPGFPALKGRGKQSAALVLPGKQSGSWEAVGSNAVGALCQAPLRIDPQTPVKLTPLK